MKTLLPTGPAARWLGNIADASVIACGWWLIALSAITCVEMLGRKLFGFSLQGVDEIGSYTYGIVGAFGFAYTLITRSHTRVDFLLSRFSPRVQALLNLLAMLTLTALAVLCLWRGLHVVLESVDMKSTAATPLATPMWIPQTIWLAGYALFAAVSLLAAWLALQLFAKGRRAQLNDQFGPQTLDEEIEAETEVRIHPQATTAPANAIEGAHA